jgi:hypothetical protein
VIEKGVFEECEGLMTSDLDKGLEIIGACAFTAFLSTTSVFPVALDQFKNGHLHIAQG